MTRGTGRPPKPAGVGTAVLSAAEVVRRGRELGHVGPDEAVSGGVLPDWAVREFVTIEPFVDYGGCPPGTVGYGLTSAGYDLRLGGRFKVFAVRDGGPVGPRRSWRDGFLDVDLTGHDWDEAGPGCRRCGADRSGPGARGRCPDPLPGTPDTVLIPPNSFALGETVEVVHVPRNVTALCLGKSTYARCGVITNFTPLEPGWYGVVTVEISNSTPRTVEVVAWQGIAQVQFFLIAGGPERSYGERPGARYQGQSGLTLPRVV